MLRTCGIILLATGAVAAAPVENTLRSATLAKQLTAALVEQQLDAIAAQDPDEHDRFVAALFFPGAQLLVVSARYASPSLLQTKLSQRHYRDIYLDLGSSAVPTSSVFFQDMKADGLCASREQTADVVYEGSAAGTIFDGDWKKQAASEAEYQRRLAKADQQYSRLLEILLTQVRGTVF